MVTDEAKKKFKEQWGNTKVNTGEDDTRREKILKIVEPLMSSDPTKAVIDIQEVKNLIGEAKLCWGCLSQVCRTRQMLSLRLLGRKLVNKYYPVRRVLVGDRNLSRSLKGKVIKDNYVYVSEYAGPKKDFDKSRKGPKRQQSLYTTSLVQKPANPAPTEKIVQANFTGLTDDDLFGPAFLYEEQELFVEKKSIPTNPIKRGYNYSANENYYD